jgi:hypothetical protein
MSAESFLLAFIAAFGLFGVLAVQGRGVETARRCLEAASTAEGTQRWSGGVRVEDRR